jgi:serine protease inhibitor
MTPRAMKTAKSNDCGVDSGKMTDSILEAQSDFALNLLREVSNQGQTTTIISPISVAIALSMVYAGAKDKTAEQMNKLLANGLIQFILN